MVAASSVLWHLVRGVVGIAGLVAAVALANAHPLPAIGLIALALVSFRGCPTCWIVGLLERVQASRQGRTSAPTCPDGRCAFPDRSPPGEGIVSRGG
jgi:hypothetical protein